MITIPIPALADLVWTARRATDSSVIAEESASCLGMRLNVRILRGDTMYGEPEMWAIWWIDDEIEAMSGEVRHMPRATNAPDRDAARAAAHDRAVKAVCNVLRLMGAQ